MKQHHVVAAIICHKNKYLCVQRGENKYPYVAFKYEFPGGKVEPGESNTVALRREIHEELQMDIQVGELFASVYYEYPDFAITMDSYLCTTKSPQLCLNEHIAYQWLRKEDLQTVSWAPADIPVVEKLMDVQRHDIEFTY
ncbi:(deoxy)nucleoside triphosphate pyrophosphohydrolase [Candidatus Uabimicrobium amorphum]|uniref:8-oxo-dGTP diphosphatase n=1 Tax=Uabimicrobium amorphum TaxID=2596890 RepID=A0A5S9IKC1_UABAM|nr:(deoxy)nucleoside triphosphate pyrophosphohydrolase [Candidatus Uabimicrobium amorphum]BBM83459.1 DNA mismatch repair protein MutT [Candidatus Uabimicrobium amorphum]